MNFIVKKDSLRKGLQRIQGITEKRSTMPILGNTMINTLDDKIEINANDLEIWIKSIIDSKINDKGKICIPAKKLMEIILELKEDDVEIKSRENYWAEIKNGNAIFNIVGVDPEEYPSMTEDKDVKYFEIESSIIKNMIKKTIYSVPEEDIRVGLTGIFNEIITKREEIFLRMVATDGYRLSLQDTKVDKGIKNIFKEPVIIPKRGMNEIKKMMDNSDIIKIGIIKNSIFFNTDNYKIKIRLIEANFPEYDNLIPEPESYNHKVIIKREEFISSVRKVSVMSEVQSKGLKIIIDKNNMNILTENPNLGKANDRMCVEYDGSGIEIGFNARYILETMNAMESENIELFIIDNEKASLWKEDDNDNFISIIMPIKLDMI